MEFKDRLRELRGNYTQKEIAKLLGVPMNSYNNWENGREPSYTVLKKIAEFHHVTVDYLIGYSDRTHDSEELSETYGLSDKAFYALNKLQTDPLNNYYGKVVISFLNELLESETSTSNLSSDVIMRDPTLRNTLSQPIKPTEMLTDLTNRFMLAIYDVEYLKENMEGMLEAVEKSAYNGVIYQHTSDIAQMIQTWLFYYCDYPPDVFSDFLDTLPE